MGSRLLQWQSKAEKRVWNVTEILITNKEKKKELS